MRTSPSCTSSRHNQRPTPRLFLDNVVLLRPGESLPDPDAKFVRQLTGLTLDAVRAAEKSLAKGREAAQAIGGDETFQERGQAEFARIEARLNGLRTELASPALGLLRWEAVSENELPLVSSKVERAVSILRFRKAYGDTGLPTTDMLVGVATSMEKIPPRTTPIALTATKEVELSLARNEKESVQIGVLPAGNGLKKVTVDASDLTTADGKVFRRENIDCDVVGYVETKHCPPYGTSYVGFWPDPILHGLGPVDIAAGDLQTFWIRVRAKTKRLASIAGLCEYRRRASCRSRCHLACACGVSLCRTTARCRWPLRSRRKKVSFRRR